jgi:hypothetical protein
MDTDSLSREVLNKYIFVFFLSSYIIFQGEWKTYLEENTFWPSQCVFFLFKQYQAGSVFGWVSAGKTTAILHTK